jgi:hypothetical protein
VEEALKMPANRNAMRVISGSTSQRPLPTPAPRSTSAANADTITPGDSKAGDKSLPFTRPPAKPIVKPSDDEHV